MMVKDKINENQNKKQYTERKRKALDYSNIPSKKILIGNRKKVIMLRNISKPGMFNQDWRGMFPTTLTPIWWKVTFVRALQA